MKIKVLVVEDELLIAENTCSFLKLKGYDVLEPVVSFNEAITSIIEHRPDVVLLDIQLRGKRTGIDLARELKNHFKIPFIYLTSNSDKETLSEAIETSPSAFITKPLRSDEIYAAIEIVMQKELNIASDERVAENIYLHDGKDYVKVLFEDILYLKSDNVYIEVYLNDSKRIITRSTLSKLSHSLSSDFFQIHRSYIVNTNNVDRVGKSVVTIRDVEIPIGEKFKKSMNKFFKENANISK